MKMIKSSAEILTKISEGGIEELKLIELIGRTCYKSEDKIAENGSTAKRFVKRLIKDGHEAMLEHSLLTVKFTVDRGITHELVRHRLFSFAQESTRYCNYSNNKFGRELTFIMPCYFLDEGGDFKNPNQYAIWKKLCLDSEKAYLSLLDAGCTPQEARAVLPNSLKSEIIVSGNYREWRHFFNLRAAEVTGSVHPQMKEVTVPLLEDVCNKIPIVFDDILEKCNGKV